MDLFIDENYEATKTIEAQQGFFPRLVIVYRQALSRERQVMKLKLATQDGTVIDVAETDLIVKYAVSINGQTLKDKVKVSHLKPAIRAIIVDLVLGFTGEDVKEDTAISTAA